MVYEFKLVAADGKTTSFTETFEGAPLSLIKPEAGATIDLSKPFDLEWTPGPDPNKTVQLVVFVEQIGLANALPVAFFPDTGRAHINQQMLGELAATGQKITIGANAIIVERKEEIVKKTITNDSVVSLVNGDGVRVTFAGKPGPARKPAFPGFNVAKGAVNINVAEVQNLYSPAMGAMAPVKSMRNLALTAFVIKGTTSGEQVSGGGGYTVTTTWEADLGVENMKNLVNAMADQFMKTAVDTLQATEVPTEKIMATEGYQNMRKARSASSSSGFYAAARGLTSFDGPAQFTIKVGGIESWYYDITKTSGSDAMFEVYFDLERKKPRKASEFTFKVKARVMCRAYPFQIVQGFIFPMLSAEWTSDTFEIKDGGTIEEMLAGLKYQDFLAAAAESLSQIRAKQGELGM
jgi:hypothetical protein